MTTIFTVQLRLFHKDTDRLFSDVGNMLNTLLPFEYSYWVPVVVIQDPLLNYTDVQYGAKSRASFTNFWEKYKNTFSVIWGRYYAARFNEDFIFSYRGDKAWKNPLEDDTRDDDIYNHSDSCYYGFDQFTVRWRVGFTPPNLGFEVEPASPIWTLPLTGKYLAANDRCYVLLSEYPERAIDTPTTPTIDNQDLYLGEWGGDWREPDLIKRFEAHKADIESVEFHWKKRLVRLMKPAPDKHQPQTLIWRQWYLDHWDNCVDSKWLAFNENSRP